MGARFELAGWLKRWSAPALVLAAALFGCGDDGDGGNPPGRGGSGGTSQPTDGGESGTSAEAGRGDGGSGAEAGGGASTGGGAGSGARGGAAGTTGEAGGGGEPEPAPFAITIEPDSLTLPRGASAWLTVSVERDSGFVDPVTITFEDLPEGFVAETVVLPDGVDSGFLPIASSEELTLGSNFELEATGSSGSRATSAPLSLTLAASQPSSQEKIRAALEASMLDYETSLLYRAYALFGDARLPDAFVGSGSEEEDNGLFDELRRRISGLSTAGQASLRPFLVRPADPESAWNVPLAARAPAAGKRVLAAAALPPTSCPELSGGPGTWISRRSTTESVRVWAQCKGEGVADAESVRLIEKTLGVLHEIYAPMTGLMSYPIEDVEGGDAAIDFYIVDAGGAATRMGGSFAPSGLGTTYNDFPEVGNATSAFVLFPRSLLYMSRFHTTVIHEFFHVLQKAYNAQYSNQAVAHWFPEASAVWASAHFDRTLAPWDDGRGAYLDAHLRFVQRFQKTPIALNSLRPEPFPYSAYIWSYFVEQETGSANFMPQIWEGLMSVASYEAADDAIDGVFPFREHFKDFALRNLNMAFTPGDPLPRGERYVALDSIFPDGESPPMMNALLTRDQEFRQTLDLPNLGTRYVALSADPLSRKVEFDFGDLQPAESIDVLALVSTLDGWVSQPLDFSDDARVVFCFNEGKTTVDRRGSFSSIVLVIANHAIRASDAVRGDLVVKSESEPCAPVWAGTITMSYRRTVELGVITSSSTTPVAFEYDDTAPQTTFTTTYRLRSGSYTYEWLGDYTNRTPACRTRQSASGTMIPGGALMGTLNGANASINIDTFFEPPTYHGTGFVLGQGSLTSNCNDNNIETTYEYNPPFTFWETAQDEVISEDGRTLEGVHRIPEIDDGVYEYRWNLTRVDE